MKYSLVLILSVLTACNHTIQNNVAGQIQLPGKDSIITVTCFMDNLGVEADHFPKIQGTMDIPSGYSEFKMTRDDLPLGDSVYSLSKAEVKTIGELLLHTDLSKLKENYRDNKSDQPTSTITIKTKQKFYKIEDYGFNGDHPLDSIYRIVYKKYAD